MREPLKVMLFKTVKPCFGRSRVDSGVGLGVGFTRSSAGVDSTFGVESGDGLVSTVACGEESGDVTGVASPVRMRAWSPFPLDSSHAITIPEKPSTKTMANIHGKELLCDFTSPAAASAEYCARNCSGLAVIVACGFADVG